MTLGYQRHPLVPARTPAPNREPDRDERSALWGNAAMAESLTTARHEEPTHWMRLASGGRESDAATPSWADDETTAQSADARPVLTQGPAPAGLGAQLVRALAPGERPPSFTDLDALVAAAPTEERQAAYRSAAVQQAIAASALSPTDKLALSTALAEGSLRWEITQGGHSDFYEYFARRNAEGPPPDMRGMSCFELILYAAWMLGQLTPAQIVGLYRPYPESTVERVDYADIGFSASLPTWSPGGTPQPSFGELVFGVSKGETEPRHVMLSLGGDEAMSLNKKQERETPTSRVSLADEAVGRTLYFGRPSWLPA